MKSFEDWASNNIDVRSKNGDEWNVICWFHSETKPSMRLNVAKGLYYCHGCHAKGSLTKFLAKDQLDTVSSSKIRSHLKESSRKQRAISESILSAYATPGGHPYWQSRGISPEDQITWDLGYDLFHDSVTIPYRDRLGGLQGIIRRNIDPDEPTRYKYPKGSKISRMLFGSCMVESETVFVVEGSIDCIKAHLHGLHAVAILGSSISDWQIRELSRLEAPHVVLMLDRDAAGRRATREISDRLMHERWLFSVRSVPTNLYGKSDEGRRAKDPGAMGAGAFEQIRELFSKNAFQT